MTGELSQTFIVAQQFEIYLEKSNLNQADMSDVQYIETRRAFYAGFGQFLLMSGKVEQLPHEIKEHVLNDILQEVQAFWAKETNVL